jgi:hypothetical protein
MVVKEVVTVLVKVLVNEEGEVDAFVLVVVVVVMGWMRKNQCFLPPLMDFDGRTWWLWKSNLDFEVFG